MLFRFLTVLGLCLPIQAVAQVSDFMLDNGMQVVVIEDHRAPVVVQMVWYKVGAADEVPGKSGIAHFLEHLMFKKTGNLALSFRIRLRPTVALTMPSPAKTIRAIISVLLQTGSD